MTFKKIPNGDYYYFTKNGTTMQIVKHTKNDSGIVGVGAGLVPS